MEAVSSSEKTQEMIRNTLRGKQCSPARLCPAIDREENHLVIPSMYLLAVFITFAFIVMKIPDRFMEEGSIFEINPTV